MILNSNLGRRALALFVLVGCLAFTPAQAQFGRFKKKVAGKPVEASTQPAEKCDNSDIVLTGDVLDRFTTAKDQPAMQAWVQKHKGEIEAAQKKKDTAKLMELAQKQQQLTMASASRCAPAPSERPGSMRRLFPLALVLSLVGPEAHPPWSTASLAVRTADGWHTFWQARDAPVHWVDADPR